MNRRLLLTLLTLPSLVGSSFCWLTAMPAQAQSAPTTEQKNSQNVSVPDLNATEPQLCTLSSHSRFKLVCEKRSKLEVSPQTKPVDYATDYQTSPLEFKFTDEESNAAIALFGCDCPACINSLRGLRTMSTTAS
jgi:hypothetical protein